MANDNLPDYLKIPERTIPSFHSRTGKPAVSVDDRPENASGYPVPGTQNPSATSVMAQDYFVTYDIRLTYLLATCLTDSKLQRYHMVEYSGPWQVRLYRHRLWLYCPRRH